MQKSQKYYVINQLLRCLKNSEALDFRTWKSQPSLQVILLNTETQYYPTSDQRVKDQVCLSHDLLHHFPAFCGSINLPNFVPFLLGACQYEDGNLLSSFLVPGLVGHWFQLAFCDTTVQMVVGMAVTLLGK